MLNESASIIDCMRDSMGISCVEIYLLALLKKHGINSSCLFENSFADLGATLNDFFMGVYNYVTYPKIPRLQEIAKEKCLIDFSSYIVDLKYIKFDYYLCGVNAGYKQSSLQPWRDDHYLLFYGEKYYDCYPPSYIESFDMSKLNCHKIGINIKENTQLPTRTDTRKVLIKNINNTKEIKADFTLTPDNIMKVRDALLVCKISRQRINAILRFEPIAEQIILMTKLCGLLEAFRLRGRIGDCKEMFNKVLELEKTWKLLKA